MRCTASRNTALRRIGAIRKASRLRIRWITSSIGCARFWIGRTRDSEEFIKSLKVDLFSDEIFVFTPKGEIIDLPKGATPLDFAYRIHSAVGNKCVGAKVNGRIVTLDTSLNTGDFVEIITQQNSKGPSRDWLKIVKTAQAKAKIRQFYKKELKDENIANGKQMLDYEAKRQAVSLPSLLKTEYVDPILRKFSFADLDDLYAAVGCAGIAAQQVVTRLSPTPYSPSSSFRAAL